MPEEPNPPQQEGQSERGQPTPEQSAVARKAWERSVGRKARLGKPIPPDPAQGQNVLPEPSAASGAVSYGPPQQITPSMSYSPRYEGSEPEPTPIVPTPQPEKVPKAPLPAPPPSQPSSFSAQRPDTGEWYTDPGVPPVQDAPFTFAPPGPSGISEGNTQQWREGPPPPQVPGGPGMGVERDGGGGDQSGVAESMQELARVADQALTLLREMLQVLQEIKSELPSVGGLT